MRTETFKQRKSNNKRRKRIIILSIIFLIVLGITAGIILAAYLSTNVYQNDKEFKEYVTKQSAADNIFTVTGKTKKNYKYGEPISYAVDYDTIKNEKIAAFRDEKIKAIEVAYEQEKAAKEDKEASENKDSKNCKPPAKALIVNTAAYDSNNGAVSLAIYSSDNEEKEKDMVKTSSHIETYLFSKETGRNILPAQALQENYRIKCSDYFMDYFQKTYNKEELLKGWDKYLTADETNFNKFIMRENDVVFYFDEGTVLKESKGIVSAKIPNLVLADAIRPSIIKRYIDPSKPMVALTYDDGPGGSSETKILDCLEKNGAVATFFYYGSKISNNPAQIKRAHDMGCEIGNHTWSHPKLTTLTNEQVAAEISKTNEAINAACGAYPTVFRPSYGMTNSTVNSIANMPVIMWTIDTLDWKTRDAQKTFESVTKNPALDGKIILMHSIHDPTAAATELIIPWLIDNGYQTVTVSELIKYKQGTPPQNGQVYR